MRLLITGANGFVGSVLCAEALICGHDVVALVRKNADRTLLPKSVTVLEGEFWKADHAHRILREAKPDAIIHAAAIVSMGRPDVEASWRVNVVGTETLAKAALEVGCKRWLQVSSMSAHPNNKAVYGASKLAADDALRALPLELTIFRPSLIYGPQRRGIFHKLVNLIDRLPVVPLVGGGKEPMRPVHVEDLAKTFMIALERKVSIRKTYCLGGPERGTFSTMVQAICKELGRKPLLLPVPLPFCRVIAMAGEFLLTTPPLTSDNVEGVAKAEQVHTDLAKNELDWAPRQFEVGLRDCLAQGLLDESLNKNAANEYQ